METRYLVDNNALNVLRRRHIQTAFFRDHCQVTTDVLWEAREHPEEAALKRNSRPQTAALVAHIRDVMKTVAAGDTRLVDLYGNKGAADPGLVGSILEATADDANKLISEVWTLVTKDRAVAIKAAEFGINVITPAALVEFIDGSLE